MQMKVANCAIEDPLQYSKTNFTLLNEIIFVTVTALILVTITHSFPKIN